ncbi:hypothetical protein NDN08_002197 [Rhodosorus marinus]|uniref:Uncharacterized protein n=1 Tax=Rhodosorus marinus TaxID=101924 RepID=A0AAV8UXC7_9RHOD|nr:hypothetical protein NDN08_002197 [Rhodosorus marinus]
MSSSRAFTVLSRSGGLMRGLSQSGGVAPGKYQRGFHSTRNMQKASQAGALKEKTIPKEEPQEKIPTREEYDWQHDKHMFYMAYTGGVNRAKAFKWAFLVFVTPWIAGMIPVVVQQKRAGVW